MEMLVGNETVRPTTRIIMFEPYVKPKKDGTAKEIALQNNLEKQK